MVIVLKLIQGFGCLGRQRINRRPICPRVNQALVVIGLLSRYTDGYDSSLLEMRLGVDFERPARTQRFLPPMRE
jgi:hypothetical protein